MWKMKATARKMTTGHQPAPMAAKESERSPIGWPLVYQSATPRADTIMPSVAMNGGILVNAISQPLMKPMMRPQTRPAATGKIGLSPVRLG